MEHTRTLGTRILVNKHPEGMECTICEEKAASHPEVVVLCKLKRLGIPYEAQTKVLGGTSGAVDFWIPSLNLIIQVDGPLHMEERGWGKALAEQQEVDRRFDKEAWQQRRRLLRLHYKDVSRGKSLESIHAAISLCTRFPSRRFKLYSPTYININAGYANKNVDV